MSILRKIAFGTSAAIALASLSISNAMAAKRPYQQTLSVQCPSDSFCAVQFPTLSAPVIIKHVSCTYASNADDVVLVARSSVDDSVVALEHQQSFIVPGSGIPTFAVNAGAYLFGDVTNFFIVEILGTLSQSAQCSITGDYIDDKA